MMRRFEIQKGMHLGPLMRNISPGDVLGWDVSTQTLTFNGDVLREQKGARFEEAIDILLRQSQKDPEHPWAKELSPVDAPVGQFEVKTGTQVILPILGCLKAAEEYLGSEVGWDSVGRKVEWTPANEEQYQFFKRFTSAIRYADALGDNLKRKANRDVNVINAWLRENGFDIQLSDPGPGLAFAVASILDVLVNWIREGEVTSIYNSKGTFPGVSIKRQEGNVVGLLNRAIHPFPVAKLETKTGDVVYMTVMDYLPGEVFSISDKVDQVRKVVTEPSNTIACDGVVFTMVDYDRRVDIGWIVGLETGPCQDDWYVSEALQQTKFRMNEKGAHAKSAVAMTLRCKCAVSHDAWIRIDRPFLLWIERSGVDIPLFAGVFAEDVWKKPVEL